MAVASVAKDELDARVKSWGMVGKNGGLIVEMEVVEYCSMVVEPYSSGTSFPFLVVAVDLYPIAFVVHIGSVHSLPDCHDEFLHYC